VFITVYKCAVGSSERNYELSILLQKHYVKSWLQREKDETVKDDRLLRHIRKIVGFVKRSLKVPDVTTLTLSGLVRNASGVDPRRLESVLISLQDEERLARALNDLATLRLAEQVFLRFSKLSKRSHRAVETMAAMSSLTPEAAGVLANDELEECGRDASCPAPPARIRAGTH
jgi:ABC-type phosphate/phosphonate transport system ATPase subunit